MALPLDLNVDNVTTIMVVRHAEVHNPRNILYGRLPGFALNEKGRQQASATARFLSTRPISVIYTSPLLRARQTAAILVEALGTVPVQTTKHLLETKTSYQGNSNDILKPGFSFYDPLPHPEDESMQDVWNRMYRFIRLASRRNPGKTIVAVSHADPIAILRLGLEGKELTTPAMHSSVYPARSSVTQLVLSPNTPYTLSYFNIASG